MPTECTSGSVTTGPLDILRRGRMSTTDSTYTATSTGEALDSAATEEEHRRKQIEQNQAAIELLRLWRKGDVQQQREAWEYLSHALDEDRLSDRKFYS